MKRQINKSIKYSLFIKKTHLRKINKCGARTIILDGCSCPCGCSSVQHLLSLPGTNRILSIIERLEACADWYARPPGDSAPHPDYKKGKLRCHFKREERASVEIIRAALLYAYRKHKRPRPTTDCSKNNKWLVLTYLRAAAYLRDGWRPYLYK